MFDMLPKEGGIFWWEEKSGQLGDMFGILGGNCAISEEEEEERG